MIDIDEVAAEVFRRYRTQLDMLLASLPVGATLCVHDTPLEGTFRPGAGACTFTVRTAAHILLGGQTCAEPVRRTQYGPMTAEIQAHVERVGNHG